MFSVFYFILNNNLQLGDMYTNNVTTTPHHVSLTNDEPQPPQCSAFETGIGMGTTNARLHQGLESQYVFQFLFYFYLYALLRFTYN